MPAPADGPAHPAGAALRDGHEAQEPLVDRDAAIAYVASVCFKHGPPRRLGVELEWLVRHTDLPDRRLDPAALVRALGRHTPPTLRPAAPDHAEPDPLPHGGAVTVEPGGQVEIASAPFPTLSELLAAVTGDVARVRAELTAAGLTPVLRAADPLRPPRRILDVPRYAAMEATFDRIGPHGRTMMCSTSAVQVCLDAGEGPAVADRWNALHELGPVLLAAFANSPAVHGRRTGWKSSRMASWFALDPERTCPPVTLDAEPAAEWARRALDTRLLCVRRDGPGGAAWTAPEVSFAEWIDGAGELGVRPTYADLDYHLTTLFPPVRPHGHVEVRYVDQQPGDEWAVPVAVICALLAEPRALDRARDAAAPSIGRWASAARHGLADRVLRRSAGEVFEIAHRVLAGTDVPAEVRDLVAGVTERRVLRGRCPADDELGEPGELGLVAVGADPFRSRPGTPSAPITGPDDDPDGADV